METLKKILWYMLKLAWKIFLILLWGTCRLAELILQQVNQFLDKIINKRK